jgi:hypothetical protein
MLHRQTPPLLQNILELRQRCIDDVEVHLSIIDDVDKFDDVPYMIPSVPCL